MPRTKRYGAILADPPWRFEARSAKGEGRSPKYKRMTIEQIAALPVKDWAKRDCVLFIWVLDCMLPQALDVIRKWGFEYKTVGFVWEKQTKKGKPHFGLGYWTRMGTEQCLIATRGHPKRLDAGVPQLIQSPRREHSRKPDETHARIRRLVRGPYLELFARQSVKGWDTWGDQRTLFDIVKPPTGRKGKRYAQRSALRSCKVSSPTARPSLQKDRRAGRGLHAPSPTRA